MDNNDWIQNLKNARKSNSKAFDSLYNEIAKKKGGNPEGNFISESSPMFSFERSFNDVENAMRFAEIAEKLPAEQQVCVNHYYIDHMTVEQIADKLELSEITVKCRLTLASEKIRKELERFEKKEAAWNKLSETSQNFADLKSKKHGVSRSGIPNNESKQAASGSSIIGLSIAEIMALTPTEIGAASAGYSTGSDAFAVTPAGSVPITAVSGSAPFAAAPTAASFSGYNTFATVPAGAAPSANAPTGYSAAAIAAGTDAAAYGLPIKNPIKPNRGGNSLKTLLMAVLIAFAIIGAATAGLFLTNSWDKLLSFADSEPQTGALISVSNSPDDDSSQAMAGSDISSESADLPEQPQGAESTAETGQKGGGLTEQEQETAGIPEHEQEATELPEHETDGLPEHEADGLTEEGTNGLTGQEPADSLATEREPEPAVNPIPVVRTTRETENRREPTPEAVSESEQETGQESEHESSSETEQETEQDTGVLDGWIDLSEQNITSAQLADMIASGAIPQNAEYLFLDYNQITDISVLSGLTDLEVLYLQGNPIDEHQLEALKAALPDCSIYD